jgi:hypothetical protein
MAGAKEIRSKIASIKSTQKITSAMEKVAVSKMRKAQMRMAASRPYAERIRQVIGHLANANPEYRHPFMIEREVKRVGYVVVSSDCGLCGGLNTNLFKALVKDMAVNRENGVEIDLCVVGSKGAAFFRNFGGNVVAAISHLGEEPSINDLIGSVKVMGSDERVLVYEAGISPRYYVWGDFRQGVQLGVEALYAHASADGQLMTTLKAEGLAIGPYAGYKWVASSGLTLEAQLGASYFAMRGDGVDENDSRFAVLLNLQVGWSF